MDLQLDGKRAIVTGGSRGIGLAVAKALVAEGVRVVIAARDPAGLEQAASQIGHPDAVTTHVVDTTDDDSVHALVQFIFESLGGVDILVNAAATPAAPGAPRTLAGLVDDDLRSEVETKVLGYLRTARASAPHMAEAGWGRIINISGLAARQTGSPFGSIRNVAVAAMTKNLADELGPSGINVTVVHPGMTVTERTPALIEALAETRGITPAEVTSQLASTTSIGRIVTAEQVADVVTFLASPRSVAVNGDAVAAAGGSPGAIHY